MDRRQFLKLSLGAVPGAGLVRAGDSLARRLPLPQKYNPESLQANLAAPVTRRLLVITLNPRLHSQGGVRISTHLNWYDPAWTVSQHISDLNYASYGYANYVVVENIDVDEFARWPPYQDGFRYNEQSYLEAWNARSPHQPHYIDYHALMAEFGIIQKVSSGHIDEVWHIGPPYDAKYEAVMAGPGGYNSNAPPLGGTDHAGRRFVIMGYNFERPPGLMLHSYGHRAEGHLSHAHRNVPERDNLWRRFLRHENVTPGIAEVGNVHFPPNAVQDYDYGNQRLVNSNCDDWLHYPWLTGDRFRMVNANEWGGGSDRAYFKWWFRHMPHLDGECDGIAHNWWRYIVDPNTY